MPSRYQLPNQTLDNIRENPDGDPLCQITSARRAGLDFDLLAPVTDLDLAQAFLFDEKTTGTSPTPTDSPDRELVAKKDGQMVGVLSYVLGPYNVSCDLVAGDQAERRQTPSNGVYVENITVEPEFRRKGIARELLRQLGRLEGNPVVCGFAINRASGKLVRHPDYENLPDLEKTEAEEITRRSAEQWFCTPFHRLEESPSNYMAN